MKIITRYLLVWPASRPPQLTLDLAPATTTFFFLFLFTVVWYIVTEFFCLWRWKKKEFSIFLLCMFIKRFKDQCLRAAVTSIKRCKVRNFTFNLLYHCSSAEPLVLKKRRKDSWWKCSKCRALFWLLHLFMLSTCQDIIWTFHKKNNWRSSGQFH